MKPSFYPDRIGDSVTREEVQKLVDYLLIEEVLATGFRHYELEFDRAVTNRKVPHFLGYVPKDIIQTSKTGAGNITWNYSEFDDDFFDVTTSAACVVRLFAGTFVKGSVA